MGGCDEHEEKSPMGWIIHIAVVLAVLALFGTSAAIATTLLLAAVWATLLLVITFTK
jgi:hypothetical protein